MNMCPSAAFCAAATMTTAADQMPFTPDPKSSSCQLYTTKAGDSLARLSALGGVDVKHILRENWDTNLTPGSLKPGLKIRMCKPQQKAAQSPEPSSCPLPSEVRLQWQQRGIITHTVLGCLQRQPHISGSGQWGGAPDQPSRPDPSIAAAGVCRQPWPGPGGRPMLQGLLQVHSVHSR
jgi:hypothetical protein